MSQYLNPASAIMAHDLTTYDGCIAAIADSVHLDADDAARLIATANAAIKAISARDKAVNDTRRTDAQTRKEKALTGATKALLALAARNPNAEPSPALAPAVPASIED